MASLLYLDTARLGQMSPAAQLAYLSFMQFAGDSGGTLYFDQFLRRGRLDGPTALFYEDLPGLQCWGGLSKLQDELKAFAGAQRDSRVLLANRSAQLMKLAARLLSGLCGNVLTTDLAWPPYAGILQRTAAAPSRLTSVSLRDAILSGRICAEEATDIVLRAFRDNRCDGLFLPAVDNLGIQFPVEEIVQAIRAQSELRFVVIDGAQALGHIPLRLHTGYCDLFIAGCHKWLQAYHPLGIAFFGRRRSTTYIESTLNRLIAAGEVDDPLLVFTEQIRSGETDGFGETVNLGPLFSCHGALQDPLLTDSLAVAGTQVWMDNAAAVIELACRSGWRPLQPHPSLRSRILLLRNPEACSRTPDRIRRRFFESGVALTAYEGGIIRLSLPNRSWHAAERAQLERAFFAA